MDHLPKEKQHRYVEYILCVLCILMGFLMISDRGLWGDEGWTALNTLPPTLGAWYRTFTTDINLDMLKPLSGFSTWLLSRVMGTSEFQLRMQNIIWLAVAVVSLAALGRHLRIWFLPLLFVTHPFVWYYIHEIRPYGMQLGGGALLLYALVRLLDRKLGDRLGVTCFIISAFILSGSSLLGLFPVAGACCVLFYAGVREKWPLNRAILITVAIFAITQIPWVLMYIYWVMGGKDGARLWSVSLGNYIYALYEFCGFAGMGPNRDYIRQVVKQGGVAAGIKAIGANILLLIPLALVWGAWFVASIKGLLDRSGDNQRTIIGRVLAYILVSAVTLGIAAALAKWPFWGRHITPLLAAWVLVLALGIRYLGRYTNIAVAVFCCLFLASSLRLRFDRAHLREDSRGPARVAQAALQQGKRVAWFAPKQPARYYGLMVNEGLVYSLKNGTLTEVTDSEAENLADMAVVNIRSDLDVGGQFRKKVEEQGLRPADTSHTGFIIYQR